MSVQVVWFKRDLRTRDHEPLFKACASGDPVIGIYVFEDIVVEHADFDAQHGEWILGSLLELRETLRELNIPLIIRRGNVLDHLNDLHCAYGIQRLHSHQETGLDHTFRRDRAVASWCLEQGVPWTEVKQQAVVRGRLNRFTRLACRGGMLRI